MKKGIVLTFSFIAVAVVAMIASLCFLFLGNTVISQVPTGVKVQQGENGWQVVTDYRESCFYEFKLEQMIDGKFMVVDTVKSDKNAVDLADCAIGVVAGEKYRFSACFATENGAGNGEFCQAIEWVPSSMLGTIDYRSVTFENGRLSWQEIAGAESYEVRTIDLQGVVKKKTVSIPRADLDLTAGKYTVFIVARSSKEAVLDGIVGKGKEIVVEKANEISEAKVKANGDLRVLCSQKIEVFQIFVNDELFLEFEGEGKAYLSRFEYVLEGFENFMTGVDFSGDEVVIKSLAKAYVLESEFVAIQK